MAKWFNATPGKPRALRERRLYAILDTVTNDFLGGPYAITIHPADAAAMRWFRDAATTKGTQVHAHPTEYELIWLGVIDDTHKIEWQYEVILTGKQWLAAQQTETEQTNAKGQ